MPYTRCPSCNKSLSNRRPYYEKKLEEIYSNNMLSEEEKKNKKQELVEDLELGNCCKIRFITSIDEERILVT